MMQEFAEKNAQMQRLIENQEVKMKFKRQLKRLASAAAASVMAVSALLPLTDTALSVSALASEYTAEDAVEWALEKAASRWSVDFDNCYGCQCVDLIKAYYDYLGYGEPIANAWEYVNILTLPNGWIRTNDPQPGDIFAWGKSNYSPYGHVGIVTEVNGDTVQTVETNKGGNNKVDYTPDPAQICNEPISKIDCFIRPNFKPSSTVQTVKVPKCGTSPNMAEGCYNIINAADGTYLNYGYDSNKIGGVDSPEQDGAYPITTKQKSGKSEQEFNLIYISEGKYKLASNYTSGLYVNCENSVPYDGVYLTGRKAFDDNTQYFYFVEDPDNAGEYVIENGQNPQWVISGAKTAGSALQVKSYTGEKSQRWKMVKVNKQSEQPSNHTENMKGIDVSEYQGNINWSDVANSGYSFAVLRNGLVDQFTGEYTLDKNFNNYYANAKSNQLYVGAYFFTGATTVAGMEAEVKWMLEQMKGKTLDLPLYLDIETDQQKTVSKSVMTEMALRGCELIEKAGFKAGIYASESLFFGGGSIIDPDALRAKGYEIWSASWDLEPTTYRYKDQCHMMQYTSTETVAGISGKVDLDMRYVPIPAAPAVTTAPVQTTAKPSTTTTAPQTTSKPTTTKPSDDENQPEIVRQEVVKSGMYSIQNANGYYLTNDATHTLHNGSTMSVQLNEGLATQWFSLKYLNDGKYSLAAGNAPDYFVNCTCATPDKVSEGVDISTWIEYDDGTQYFYLAPVSDSHELKGGFYICSVLHPELVIAPQYDDIVGSGLKLQKYDPQNDSQIWNFVKPSVPAVETKQNVKPADYNIANAAVGFYMTNRTDIALGKGHPIDMSLNESLSVQRFTLKHIGKGQYTLAAGGEKDRFVNCTVSTPDLVKAGVQISSWEEYTDGTQYFYFTWLGDDQYIIRSALNKELVIAPRSEDCGSNLELQKFDMTNMLQRWKLVECKPAVTTTAPVTTTKPASTTTKTTSSTTKTTSTTIKTTVTTVTTTTEKKADELKPMLKETVKQGEYSIQNAGNGFYMTNQLQKALGSQGHPISIELYENLAEQYFTMKYLGDGQYMIVISADPDYVVNSTCAKPENIRLDIDVCSWTKVNDGRQYYYITPVGKTEDGETEYVIQNAYRPELVVAPAYDDIVGSTLKLHYYDAKNAAQRWKLHLHEAETTSAPKETTTITVSSTTKPVTTTTMPKTSATTEKNDKSTTTATVTTTRTEPASTSTQTTTKNDKSTTSITVTTTVTEPAITSTKATTTQPDTTVTSSPETTTVTATTPAETKHLTGDADGNGEISAEDAQLALHVYVCSMAGLDSGMTAEQLAAIDIDGDGRVTAADAQYILLYYVNNVVSGTAITWEELKGNKAQAHPFLFNIKRLFQIVF